MKGPEAMPTMRRLAWVTLTVLTLSAGRGSEAADTCANDRTAGRDPVAMLHVLLDDGCLGGPSDTDPEIVGLQKAIGGLSSLEDVDRRLQTLDIVGTVTARFGAMAAPDVSQECRAQLGTALDSISTALLKGAVVLQGDVPCSPSSAFAATCWEPDSLSFDIPAIPGCTPLSAGVPSQGSSETLLTMAVVTHDALGGFSAPALRAYGAQASELRGQWWAYFHETRSQYPWELVGNALCFKRQIDKNRGAFHSPPNHQWIYLHPGAAVTYLPDAPDGEQLKLALSVELLGFNRWRWKGESASPALGASIVANYADVATINDWSFGVAIHVQHRYTFGATRSSGATGFFLSADLAQFVTDKRKKAKSFLKTLKSST